jgi:predicted ester cyclase
MSADDLAHAARKRRVYDGFARLSTSAGAARAACLSDLYADQAACFVSHPLNELHGLGAIERALWSPLQTAFPDLERTATMLVAGTFNNADIVACLGHYDGTFAADWLGIPASHKATRLRFGEAHRFHEGKIVQSWMLIDVLDVMRQARVWLLPESLGAEGMWTAPGGERGLEIDSYRREEGERSLAHVLAMHGALGTFDGRDLRSMDHAKFWTPHFSWYGPAGIGTTRGLAGFEAHHQIPFLIAFPDRKGGQHYMRLAEGPNVVTGGWPSVTATHTGGGFLGMPASGRRVGMRVMDFYRCEGDLIAENWVPLDILHLVNQMGYDIFARLAHLRGQPQRALPQPTGLETAS